MRTKTDFILFYLGSVRQFLWLSLILGIYFLLFVSMAVVYATQFAFLAFFENSRTSSLPAPCNFPTTPYRIQAPLWRAQAPRQTQTPPSPPRPSPTWATSIECPVPPLAGWAPQSGRQKSPSITCSMKIPGRTLSCGEIWIGSGPSVLPRLSLPDDTV